MSHWMTSGRSRLKAKQKRSFSQRAQQRASLGSVEAVLLPAAPSSPSDRAEFHPRRRRRSHVGDAFTNPSNPLALRAVVASSDPSPRKMQEEAALHQHRHPSETTGTENYRRIRNPDRSQIPGLYLHQNGSKVPVQSYRVVDTSTFRQNIRETRSRPPENQSYHPGAARDPGGNMHRIDTREARYTGEQSMARQHRLEAHPLAPPFAGRVPTHSHLQYSHAMHLPPETHAGHSNFQFSHAGNVVSGPPAETHARFPIQQREQARFPMQQREQERLASLPVEEFDVFFPNDGVPNEPPLGVDYTLHGTQNHGYEVLEEQYLNDYDLLTHAAPPAHHPHFGDPRVSHPVTDWDLNPAGLQSGHGGYAQDEFRGMDFGRNAVTSHTGHFQPPMGLAERFAARAGVHLTPRDQHTLPFNPQPFYEPHPSSGITLGSMSPLPRNQSFGSRKRKPADIFLERRQSVGYPGQNQVNERQQGQQVDPYAEEFRAIPRESVGNGHRGPKLVSDGGIDRFRTHGGATGQVEQRSPGIAHFQQRGTPQRPGEQQETETITMFPTWKGPAEKWKEPAENSQQQEIETITMFPTWKGPAENSQQNVRPAFDTRLQKNPYGENAKKRMPENDWRNPPLVQPFGNNTQLLNATQPADGTLRRPQESVSVPFPAQSVPVTSKPQPPQVNMTHQQNRRPSSPRLPPAEIVLRNDQQVDRQPLISKPAKENMNHFEQPIDVGVEPHHFPAALHPSYDSPSYLRFFNESIEVTLKGDLSRRPTSPIGAAADHATQESDTLDDVDFEGKTSIWGAFVRQQQ